LAAGDTNSYRYVLNNPLRYADAYGFTAQDVQDAINYIAEYYGMKAASYNFGTPPGSTGMAIPFANHIMVSSKYEGTLTDAQKQNLLMTVRHEYQHIFDGTLKTILNSHEEHDQITTDSFNYSLRNINAFLDYQRKTSCPSN